MTFAARWGLRLAAATALALVGAAYKPTQASDEKKDAFGSLTVDEVQAHIAKGDVSIFDNNSKKRWADEHVPTAKWVDYKKIEAQDLPQDKSRLLVFYCANEH